ncbi:MAG: hypothetical protein AAF447_14165 [Myxococcota bacterium]
MLECFRAHLDPRAFDEGVGSSPAASRRARQLTWSAAKRGHALAEAALFGPATFVGLSWLVAPRALAALAQPGRVAVGLFALLAAIAVFSRRDFSFLRGPLALATAGSLLVVVGSALLARSPGPLFAFAMVACAALATLEQAAAVRRGWRPLPYLGAALQLLARPIFAPVPALGRALLRLADLAGRPLVAANAGLRRALRPARLPDGLRPRR